MLVRNCAGGVVFHEDKVFLLQNEKGEWVLPKGVMRNGELPTDVAVKRVKEETGITADVVSTVGNTNYEFYSVTRQKPVCNKITWFLMQSPNEEYSVSKEERFLEGGFFTIDDAIRKVTYSQDKSIVNLSFKKYKEIS